MTPGTDVPSSVPRISATVVASTYPDPALARLMAANYRAFRRRRSLLLLNLERQVQITELPWVRAAAPHSVTAVDEALAVTKRVSVGHAPPAWCARVDWPTWRVLPPRPPGPEPGTLLLSYTPLGIGL